jgi:diacylglycerol kinase family enzyme
VSLGVLPAGTLNHLAKDLGIPLELAKAARIAVAGDATAIDVGRASDRVFINTSSLGAYIVYVRARERLEPRLGYWLASFVASLRVLFGSRLFTVEIQVDGVTRRYRTPLVFIGVGERELKVPKLGGRVEGGKRGLHVLVVQGRTGARLFVLALAAAARGLESIARGPAVDAFLVDRCRIELPKKSMRIALDGEIVAAEGPVEYALWRDAVRVVAPSSTSLEKDSREG